MIIQLVVFAFQLYQIVLLVRVVMSWVHADPYHPVVQWIYRLTEPVLAPVRRILPANGMGIDFSPLVVLLGMYILQRILFGSGFIL